MLIYIPTSFSPTAIFSDNTKIIGRMLRPLPIKQIVLCRLYYCILSYLSSSLVWISMYCRQSSM